MPRSRRRLLLPIVAALAVGAVGCRTSQRAAGAEVAQEPTTLRVDNRAFNDMTIYVVRGAQRIRLGLANGNTQTVLRIPAYLIMTSTPLRFIADPVGSQRAPVSDEVLVNPGDQVGLLIPPG